MIDPRTALCRAILRAYPEGDPDALMMGMIKSLWSDFRANVAEHPYMLQNRQDRCLLDAVGLWLQTPWSERRRVLAALIATDILEGVDAPIPDRVLRSDTEFKAAIAAARDAVKH